MTEHNVAPSHAETSAVDLRLYGLPGAEHMYLDVPSLYESEIDPWVDDPNDPEQETQREWDVEEWDVEDPINLMPRADWFLDHLEESLCEEHTHDNDDCSWIFRTPAVLAAAEELRRVIASKVTWHQARKKLADHKLTFDANGVPLLDGEPIYLDGARRMGEPRIMPAELLRALERLAAEADRKAEVWEERQGFEVEEFRLRTEAVVLREAAAVVKAHYFDGSSDADS